MISNEMMTVEFAAERIQPKLEAQRVAWKAYMAACGKDAPLLQETGLALRDAEQALVVAIEIYLPIITEAVARAKEAA